MARGEIEPPTRSNLTSQRGRLYGRERSLCRLSAVLELLADCGWFVMLHQF